MSSPIRFLGPLNTTAKHDWYVARVNHNDPLDAIRKQTTGDFTKSVFIYPFGGTLSEVKAYIDNAEEPWIRKEMTWVPNEFVEEDLFNNITYPT